jgi:type VI secretion system lysozyme-like protein
MLTIQKWLVQRRKNMRVFQPIYNEPKNVLGAKQLFFDLLIDDEPDTPWEDTSKSYLDPDELVESIASEISKVLNTRLTAKRADYDELAMDPLNFGLPSLFGLTDFNSFDAVNPKQWRRIANLCKNAITAFESRITKVEVSIDGFDPFKQALNISVTGNLAIDKMYGEVRFPLILDCSNAR